VPVEGTVESRNQGGFVVKVGGVRAFCPASQIGERQGTNPAEIINQTFEFRITEWDDGKGMVVSRRAVLDEARKAAREELGGRFNVGDVLQGRVTQVREFGAFVDLGGVEGMIHVTEMGTPRIKSPGERGAVGDAVEVIVLRVESDKGRVALRLRHD
jgi:small subunit ribosomal protein S1